MVPAPAGRAVSPAGRQALTGMEGALAQHRWRAAWRVPLGGSRAAMRKSKSVEISHRCRMMVQAARARARAIHRVRFWVATHRDRKHQSLLNSTGPSPAGAIRRPAALRQRAKPRKSPRRNRPQAQKPPRAGPGTEYSTPVANPASGNPLRPFPYGGPRAERPTDPNARNVAGGSTTARSATASPHFGQTNPSTPNTRQSSSLQGRHRDRPRPRFGSRFPTLAGRFFV